ncbi:hypothetical protein AN278_008780 (plasmid) [Pediococcus pentosaceus]|uniref:hypothetical protein n=1 Tax=Pediococcus pentosaceus TaxID=1255 RepID=UPI0006D8AC8C|nr:hypothetical protein [Pediococcus pentosaceus]ANI98605.1 hypothetical protein AN278_008780 [Pediococcus pentosaceus]KQB79696.1 hypothetical protein AN278_08735 [Pediococcus pentosaceus]
MKQMVIEIISKVLTKENIDFAIKVVKFIGTALFIPIINWGWHQMNYLKFKGMLKREYVDSVEYSNSVDSIGIPAKQLVYLRDKEISCIKSPIQFKYIRMIEYTLMFLGACQEIQNTYVFNSPFEVGKDNTNVYTEKFNYLKNVYKKRQRKYTGLRRDNFITDGELEKLKKSVEIQLKKLQDKT